MGLLEDLQDQINEMKTIVSGMKDSIDFLTKTILDERGEELNSGTICSILRISPRSFSAYKERLTPYDLYKRGSRYFIKRDDLLKFQNDNLKNGGGDTRVAAA